MGFIVRERLCMTFDDAIEYITDALKFGINPGLEKIEAVCSMLGNPQLKYPAVQITGTNGKTSTAWMTSSLLTATGKKTGCYTSPHLHSYRERIAIDGEIISEQDFTETLYAIKPALEDTKNRHGDLTEFEILTAMAVYYFAEVAVDAAVFEVGLGGRWDATSVVNPRVAAITGVSLDHTNRLGETVEEIAWDKAHIIKTGCVAVVGNMPPEALKKVEDRCKSVGVETKLLFRDFWFNDIEIIKNKGSRFSIEGVFAKYDDVKLPVFGTFQEYNFTMAVAVCESFFGTAIESRAIDRAGVGIVCPGRFELLSKNPLVVLDGAHNPEGIGMVVDSLPKAFDFKKLHVVLAVSNDKDIEQMLEILTPDVATLILSRNNSSRSASLERLTDIAIRSGNSYSIEPDLRKAIDLVMHIAAAEDLVCITGSFYTVADARELLNSANSD
jgi:dihydrofolate synthase/folylpolyglutamate synthase